MYTIGDMHLGSCREVVVSWYGTKDSMSKSHILSQSHCNAIMSNPQDDNTMVSVTTDSTQWINFIITSTKAKHVADVFGHMGEQY